jgi:chaperone required for assembly of F1-ATPase
MDKLKVIEEGVKRFAVTLNGVNVLKSPLGHQYILPTRDIADLLVQEMQGRLKTGHLVNKTVTRALQVEREDECGGEVDLIIKSLRNYYQTDTCLYRDGGVDCDYSKWDRCIKSFTDCTGLTPSPTTSLLNTECSDREGLDRLLQSISGWKMAALELATANLKSFILAYLAVNEQVVSTEEAVGCALLEQATQSRRWGVLDEHRLEQRRLCMVVNLSKLVGSS